MTAKQFLRACRSRYPRNWRRWWRPLWRCLDDASRAVVTVDDLPGPAWCMLQLDLPVAVGQELERLKQL